MLLESDISVNSCEVYPQGGGNLWITVHNSFDFVGNSFIAERNPAFSIPSPLVTHSSAQGCFSATSVRDQGFSSLSTENQSGYYEEEFLMRDSGLSEPVEGSPDQKRKAFEIRTETKVKSGVFQ
jgi:hypothetical protein